MVAEAYLKSKPIIEDEGVDVFINFLHAIWKAKAGDVELKNLFNSIQLDINLPPLALYGLFMSRSPLTVDQALIMKEILDLGGK
jgi:hypothetical protein